MEFSGAILTGGASRRLGQDKTRVRVAGVPLTEIVARSLASAGAGEVIAIGGAATLVDEVDSLTRWIPDAFPGQGPLGGIVTAFREALCDVLVVLACDTPEIDSTTPSRLVDALQRNESAAVAFAVVDEREQPLTAAWRISRCGSILEEAFERGERAPRNVLPLIDAVAVTSIPSSAVADVDRPSDLDRYAR